MRKANVNFFRIEAYLILLCFALLSFTDALFFKIEDKIPHQQKDMVRFIVILDLLRWSGIKPAVSMRCASYSVPHNP